MGYRQTLVIRLSIWFIKLVQIGDISWLLGCDYSDCAYRLVVRTLGWTYIDFISNYQILHVIIIIPSYLGILDLINFFFPSWASKRNSLCLLCFFSFFLSYQIIAVSRKLLVFQINTKVSVCFFYEVYFVLFMKAKEYLTTFYIISIMELAVFLL